MLVFGGKMETGVNKLLEGTGEAIKTGKKSRKDIWNVNTEKEYHEEKSGN